MNNTPNVPTLVNPKTGAAYRTGSLAYINPLREWEVTQPGEPFFSTYTMFATHVLQPGGWESIHGDDAAVAAELLRPEWATDMSNGEWVVGAQLCTKDGRRMGNACIVGASRRGWEVVTDAGTVMVMQDAELEEVFHRPQWIMDPRTCPGQRAIDAKVEGEPEDDDLLNGTISDLLQGFGASEDHQLLIDTLRKARLTEKTLNRVHRAIVNAEKYAGHREGLESLSVWWTMHEAQWELVGQVVPDDAVVLHFMGSGASTQVTAGDMRKAFPRQQELLDPSAVAATRTAPFEQPAVVRDSTPGKANE